MRPADPTPRGETSATGAAVSDAAGERAPLVTVVIPSYQRLGPLRRAVDSVLAQDGEPCALVVVDDGSSDGSGDWLRDQAPRGLTAIHQENRGVSAARNRGAAAARTPWLVFLDSDDELAPDALARFRRAFAPGVGLVSGGMSIRREPGDGEWHRRPERWGPASSGWRVTPLAGGFAVRRDLFLAAGGYCESLRYAENTELLLRIAARCRQLRLEVRWFDEPVAIYRLQDRPLGRRRVEEQLAASEHLLRHHQPLLLQSPRTYAQVCANAGVRAARLEEYRRARRHFLRAVLYAPGEWRHYGRLALTGLPALRRRLWPPVAAEP